MGVNRIETYGVLEWNNCKSMIPDSSRKGTGSSLGRSVSLKESLSSDSTSEMQVPYNHDVLENGTKMMFLRQSKV